MTDQKTSPLAYSIAETARDANCGRSKVYEEIAAGRLRARKLGRRTIILAEDRKAWLESLPSSGRASDAC